MKETELPLMNCSFTGTDPSSLMAETAQLRKIITKRGTLEILIPLCCTTEPVRYKQFHKALQGISSKTLASRLKELEKRGILERRAFSENPPRVEDRLTAQGQELVGPGMELFQMLQKAAKMRLTD